ncbi:hypothetical protein B4Q04_03575 [Zobellia sp. OII3]|nr:hypothetical protein B4Q04_03575 [Zobellia sp. OII3]
MKRYISLLSLFVIVVLSVACNKDDDHEEALRSTVYQLEATEGFNVTGTVTFTEGDDGTTNVLVKLVDSNTDEHPAYIRYSSGDEKDNIAITLKKCTCSVGETVVSKLDNGEPIDYDGLLQLDAYVSIHQSLEDMETIVSTVKIGTGH